MFLLNLTPVEFIALLGALSGLVAALYLLDRARRKKVVSTLRFWKPVAVAVDSNARRRIREPWSLLLQLASLVLLLLAIAQLQLGSRERRGRDHVLLLDTGSWSAETTSAGTLLDREKQTALQFLSSLPNRDRVMLVRADALASPATGFTADRARLREALRDSRPSGSALNIEQALAFAREAQSWSGALAGEIVYVGPGRIDDRDAATKTVSNLRVLRIAANLENCGIRRLFVRRSDEDIRAWQATVTVKNYGIQEHIVRLRARFAGTAFAPRLYTLKPGEEIAPEYSFVTNTAGSLEVEIAPGDSVGSGHDALASDDRARLQLPRNGPVRIVVYTDRKNALLPLLAANHRLDVKFFAPAQYVPRPAADVALLDRFAPAAPPEIPSLWIDPPRAGSPLPVKTLLQDSVVESWDSETPLSTGLHAKAHLGAAEVFETFEGDTPVANVQQGPTVVARASGDRGPKLAAIGFDPFNGELRYELTTPLLFANLLHWLSPEAFRTLDLVASRVGAAVVPLDAIERAAHIRVLDENGTRIPFTVRKQTLQLFATHPGTIRVLSAYRERLLSLSLPEVAQFAWNPPQTARSGLPVFRRLPGPIDLWRWLTIAAGLLLVCEWIIYGRRGSWRISPRTVLKALSFVVIIAALCEPTMTMPETKTGAVVLVDTSRSVPQSDLARAGSLVGQMEQHKRGNWMKVVPFAGGTRNFLPKEVASGWHFAQTPGDSGNATNLEAALASSMSAVPAGHIPRLVLISDGNENEGSSARAMAELAQLHVPVDTISLAGRSANGLHLESVSMPHEAYAGERIPIDLTLDSPAGISASVEIFAEGKSLGTSSVSLTPGTNTVRIHARVNANGATELSGRIVAASGGELPFEQPIALRRPRVLYLSQDPPGSEANLLTALNQAQFDVTRDVLLIEKDLSAIQLVILNNLDLDIFTESQKSRLEEYVKAGGGLLLIGGERQVYKDETRMDALDRALPARLAPPNSPEGACVALIIDKSSSMEGRKIDLARLSAIGVVDHLRPVDTIGVLIFDNSFQWAVPMRRATDKSLMKRLISGINPDGGTQIAPALAEAYRKVLSSKAVSKHIVLLTDGISEEGDSMDLAKEAVQHQVTISTVGLGQDVNRSYLERIAAASGGRSYFLNDPQGLEQILLKDVEDYSGSTAVEKPLEPFVEHPAEVLDDVGMEHAPPLKGYVRFTTKAEAETILGINEEKKDPLYVRWQYGLGRAAVFSSDAKSRWAEAWVSWPGFDKFWINATRDLLTHTDPSEAGAQFDAANSDIVVTFRLSATVPEPAAAPQIFVLGPNGFEKPIAIEKISSRFYQGRLHIGPLRGLFRIRPLADSIAFPEVGLYRQQEELQDYGSNQPLLSEIANLTGGRINPSPASIFDAGGRQIYAIWRLWPLLLALALALTIAELIARKWSGLMQSLHWR